MTVVVLLILVVLWIVVLTPGMVGKLREKRSTESIDSFHHRLHLLERTGPKIVAPAYRLQTAQSHTGATPGASGLPSVSSMPGRANLVLLRPVDGGGPGDDAQVVDERHGGHYQRVLSTQPDLAAPVLAPSGPDPRRREARRRRRDILTGLLVTLVCTGLLGIIHSLRALWIVTVVSAVALAAFVALAAYATALATQEHQDLRMQRGLRADTDPLDRAAAGYPGGWDDEPGDGLDEDGGDGQGFDEEWEPRRAAAR